jgi:retron-type reverse transcriptase
MREAEHRSTESLLRNTEGALKPESVSTKQERIAKLAAENPAMAFTSLNHYLDAEWLRYAYECTRKDGAVGVDGQTAQGYATKLEQNLQSLMDRLKSGRYRAPPVRRHYIDKSDGGKRALGIPSFEDKVAQRAIVMLLEPIYEQDFRQCSFGFRSGRNAHQALRVIRHGIVAQGARWVLEVDVRKYFDSIDHAKLRELLARRVTDGVVRRMIDKWLKAGVLERGQISFPGVGTPQGGVISPVLSNVFLHYGAPGQIWCFQRAKFPPRQEVQPPHRESSLGSEEVTNRTKRRQSDARAVTKVKQISLVKYLSAGRQHRSGWQAPVGAPQMARWPETAAGSECTARSKTEASRDLGDPLRSRSALGADRVCRTRWLTPEKGRCCSVKSDSLVVLRARESRVHGEAAKQMKTGYRDTSPAHAEAGV